MKNKIIHSGLICLLSYSFSFSQGHRVNESARKESVAIAEIAELEVSPYEEVIERRQSTKSEKMWKKRALKLKRKEDKANKKRRRRKIASYR